VVNGMVGPQPGDLMEEPMSPVRSEIADGYDQGDLAGSRPGARPQVAAV
jgi:hypothetical protein